MADIFSKSQDPAVIESIYDMHQRIGYACSSKLQVIRKELKASQAEVEALEREVASLKPKSEDEKAYGTTVGMLSVSLESDREAYRTYCQQLEDAKAKLAATYDQSSAGATELKRLLDKIPAEFKQMKAGFDIMHYSTKTYFQMDDSNMFVRGTIVNIKPADVQSFSYDTRRVDHFDIVNGIWNNISALRVC